MGKSRLLPLLGGFRRQQIAIDDSQATATYANLCGVTQTPREVVLDFAMDTVPTDNGQVRPSVSRRIVANVYTAKRMLHALRLTVQRHEATFGVLPGQDLGNRIDLDDAGSVPSYANFCRVTGTPEEVIVDFGLNAEPYDVPTQGIRVSWRVVTDFHTAKMLARDLESAIGRHEARHGAIETDVQKRVRPQAFGPPQH